MKCAIDVRETALLALLLLIAGCCDKATLERCRAEAMERHKLTQKPALTAPNGPIKFEIKSAADAVIGLELARSACVDGKGGGAEVKVKWDVSRPGLSGVRVRVGSNGSADKIWTEAGPSGEGVTGPWIGDGSLLRFSDSFDDSTLAEVLVHGLACGAGQTR